MEQSNVSNTIITVDENVIYVDIVDYLSERIVDNAKVRVVTADSKIHDTLEHFLTTCNALNEVSVGYKSITLPNAATYQLSEYEFSKEFQIFHYPCFIGLTEDYEALNIAKPMWFKVTDDAHVLDPIEFKEAQTKLLRSFRRQYVPTFNAGQNRSMTLQSLKIFGSGDMISTLDFDANYVLPPIIEYEFFDDNYFSYPMEEYIKKRFFDWFDELSK